MKLTIPELSELPLPCALYDADGGLVSSTPEWRGLAPGSLPYLITTSRLVVNPPDPDPASDLLVQRLLAVMQAARQAAPFDRACRINMLSASLRLLAGYPLPESGTTQDLLEHARVGIEARTDLKLEIQASPKPFQILEPAVAALIVVQLAANAEAHEQIETLRIRQRGRQIHLVWQGEGGARSLKTSRQEEQRHRWGLGFSRLAADAIGAAIYAPSAVDGTVTETLELGLQRLALPLALCLGTKISKCTETFTEETGLGFSDDAARQPHFAALLTKAMTAPDQIVTDSGWSARAVGRRIWLALPPQNPKSRAQDILSGMAHEKALWRDLPEPENSRLYALTTLLDSLLGAPDFPRVGAEYWNQQMKLLARAFKLTFQVPRFDGASAVEPRICAFFAAEFGSAFETEGAHLYLTIKAEKREDPFMRLFLKPGDTELRLS